MIGNTSAGIIIIGMALSCIARPAWAGEVKGQWMRDDGVARVKIATCGSFVCGTVTWLKDPNGAGKVGEKVFFDMKASGESAWAGAAFNPEDGNTYSGKMVVSGNRLVTTGCALGGLICKSLNWTRV